jgi:hypothetical protein
MLLGSNRNTTIAGCGQEQEADGEGGQEGQSRVKDTADGRRKRPTAAAAARRTAGDRETVKETGGTVLLLLQLPNWSSRACSFCFVSD